MNYSDLHRIVFTDGYPGYKPSVRELPNGDGKVDADKRYAHIAMKYLSDDVVSSRRDWAALVAALTEAHQLALKVATALCVPEAFMPSVQYSALRVLEYAPGAISNLHTDFDLFTLMMYRDQPDRFVTDEYDVRATSSFEQTSALHCARELNRQLHLGELAELLGLGTATPHEVIASKTRQCSIVYFAIPDHNAVLPGGLTVGAWIDERMARSRITVAA